MGSRREYIVEEEGAGLRLDRYLSSKEPDLSRSYLQHLIVEGEVLVDGVVKKKSHLLSPGETVLLQIPPPVDPRPIPQSLPLHILYEDSSLLVLNKEPGLVVHPAPGHPDKTLVNALLAHVPDLSGIGGVKRPGIVHRLDKDTSGVMVVAKGDRAHQHLKEQFTSRTVHKYYLALVEGHFPHDTLVVDAPIGRDPQFRKRMKVTRKGKRAVTHITLRRHFLDSSLLWVKLETGRMHQIRVHTHYLGHPVVGDPLYGRKKRQKKVLRQLLHSFSLGFFHPLKGVWMEFHAPLPRDFLDFLQKQKGYI